MTTVLLEMTHGTSWKKHNLFSECRIRTKLPLIVICLVILVVFLLSTNYYSSFEPPIIGQFQPVQYEVFKNACVERTTSTPKVMEVRLETNRKVNQSVIKYGPATVGNFNRNVTKLHQNSTKNHLNNTGFMWNDTRLDILSMVGN